MLPRGSCQCNEGFGLYDYNARYYDPYLNRFISPDTIVPDPADPQSLNRFSYVGNNPVRYMDPTGHTRRTPWIDGVMSVEFALASLKARPLPESYVRVGKQYTDGVWSGESAGVIVAPNAILTHNHHFVNGRRSEDMHYLWLKDSSGRSHTTSFFRYARVDGGLSLFVTYSDFATPDDVAQLGDGASLRRCTFADQAVWVGVEKRPPLVPGLYRTVVAETGLLKKTGSGIFYDVIRVSPDRTIVGDSGAPLYIDGTVYAINNYGEGYYGAITDPSHVLNMIAQMTRELRDPVTEATVGPYTME